MLLYHGTSARHLPVILRAGLRPRRNRRESNWEHTVASNPHAVYLTTAYAPYYAACALQGKRDRLAILEIDTDKLCQSKLCPDEDFLEQATRRNSDHPEWEEMDMYARTAAYRSVMLSEYGDQWEASVKHLGTCAYLGTIPASAITRYSTYALRSKDSVPAVTHSLAEPTMTVANYKFVGDFYRKFTNWFFGGRLTCLDMQFPGLTKEQAQLAMTAIEPLDGRQDRMAAMIDERLRQHLGVKMYVRQGAGFKLVFVGGARPAPAGQYQGPGE